MPHTGHAVSPGGAEEPDRPWHAMPLGAAVCAFLTHAAAMHTPGLQTILGAGPLPVGAWAAMGALALSIFVVMELHKLWWRWGAFYSR